MIIKTDDPADSAIDEVRQLQIRPQNHSEVDEVEDSKDHSAHDLHQSSSSS